MEPSENSYGAYLPKEHRGRGAQASTARRESSICAIRKKLESSVQGVAFRAQCVGFRAYLNPK